MAGVSNYTMFHNNKRIAFLTDDGKYAFQLYSPATPDYNGEYRDAACTNYDFSLITNHFRFDIFERPIDPVKYQRWHVANIVFVYESNYSTHAIKFVLNSTQNEVYRSYFGEIFHKLKLYMEEIVENMSEDVKILSSEEFGECWKITVAEYKRMKKKLLSW